MLQQAATSQTEFDSMGVGAGTAEDDTDEESYTHM